MNAEVNIKPVFEINFLHKYYRNLVAFVTVSNVRYYGGGVASEAEVM